MSRYDAVRLFLAISIAICGAIAALPEDQIWSSVRIVSGVVAAGCGTGQLFLDKLGAERKRRRSPRTKKPVRPKKAKLHARS